MITATDKDMDWTVELSDPGTQGWNPMLLVLGIIFLVLVVVFLVLNIVMRWKKKHFARASSAVLGTGSAFFALIFLGIGLNMANDPLDDREYAQDAEDALIARGITSPPAWRSDLLWGTLDGNSSQSRDDDEALGKQGDFDVYTGPRGDAYCRVHARQLADRVQFKAGCLPGTPQAVTFSDRDAFDTVVADAGFTAEAHEDDLTRSGGGHDPSAFDTTRVTLNSEHQRCTADLADGQVAGSAHQVWVTSTTCPIDGWEAVRVGDPEEF